PSYLLLFPTRRSSDLVIFPVLDALKFFIANGLAPTITWLWNNIVRPAFAGISKAVEVAWAVISLIFNIIKWTIENVLAPVFTWLDRKSPHLNSSHVKK